MSLVNYAGVPETFSIWKKEANSLKLNQITLLEAVSRRLRARVDWSGHYAHPSGVGDERELALVEALQGLFPSRFGMTRGKIVDANGTLSKELDLIVFENSEVFTAMTVAGRRVIPVESVYGVVEVKSKLDKANYKKALAELASIDCLKRYYIPTGGRNDIARGYRRRLKDGLVPHETLPNLGRIWSIIVAFESVQLKTISGYMKHLGVPSGLAHICTPGSHLISLFAKPRGYRALKLGEASLGVLMWVLLDLLNENRRVYHFRPDFGKYRSEIIYALAPIKSYKLSGATE